MLVEVVDERNLKMACVVPSGKPKAVVLLLVRLGHAGLGQVGAAERVGSTVGCFLVRVLGTVTEPVPRYKLVSRRLLSLYVMCDSVVDGTRLACVREAHGAARRALRRDKHGDATCCT